MWTEVHLCSQPQPLTRFNSNEVTDTSSPQCFSNKTVYFACIVYSINFYINSFCAPSFYCLPAGKNMCHFTA